MASTAGNLGSFPGKFYVIMGTRFLVFVLLVGGMLFLSTGRVQAGKPITIAMGSSSYAVQAGLYVGPIQSNRMAEQLVHAGYAAWVEERPQGQGKMLYFVLVGPFADESQANEAVRNIASKFKIEPFIVDLNQR